LESVAGIASDAKTNGLDTSRAATVVITVKIPLPNLCNIVYLLS